MKHMRSGFFAFFFILFSSFSFGQKIELDTVYYQGSDIIQPGEDFTVLEVCELDKKGRKVGICEVSNKAGNVVERTTYVKDQKEGVYQRFYPHGGLMLEGVYSKGIKDGAWISYNAEGKPINLEFYEKGETLISRALELVGEATGKDIEFVVVEEQAKFPGGPQGWMNFLSDNLHYPKEAMEKGIEGPVFLKFLVSKEGLVINPEVTDSPSPLLSTEALRILRISPNWIPKKIKGEPVDSYMEFRIVFRLG